MKYLHRSSNQNQWYQNQRCDRIVISLNQFHIVNFIGIKRLWQCLTVIIRVGNIIHKCWIDIVHRVFAFTIACDCEELNNKSATLVFVFRLHNSALPGPPPSSDPTFVLNCSVIWFKYGSTLGWPAYGDVRSVLDVNNTGGCVEANEYLLPVNAPCEVPSDTNEYLSSTNEYPCQKNTGLSMEYLS